MSKLQRKTEQFGHFMPWLLKETKSGNVTWTRRGRCWTSVTDPDWTSFTITTIVSGEEIRVSWAYPSEASERSRYVVDTVKTKINQADLIQAIVFSLNFKY